MRPLVKSSGLDDYLTTIYRLMEVYGCARTTKISEELGVTPATTSKLIRYLERKGLVKRVKYGGITLTEDGLEIAIRTIRKHRVAEVFLRDFLGVDLLHAHVYAHLLEHLPDDLINKIYVKLGNPTICPHGNTINVSFRRVGENSIKLDEVEVGAEVVITRIIGELTQALKELNQLGLSIGSKVRVVGRSTALLFIEIPGRGTHRILRDTAKTVVVRW